MSMVACPDCGQVVSAREAACPGCGRAIAGLPVREMPAGAYPPREQPAAYAAPASAPYGGPAGYGAPAAYGSPAPYGAPAPYGGAGPYAAPAQWAPAAPPAPLADARQTVQLGYIMLAAAFVFAPLWAVAGILGYTRRDAVRGTWLESHCNWLVDTVLVGLCGLVASIVLTIGFMVVFAPLALLMMMGLGFGMVGWHVYRLVRGWMLFGQGKPATGLLSPPRW